MTSTLTQTALVVLVPEADPVVDHWRQRLDPSASLGVPAHITVLFPFVPPAAVTPAVLSALANHFSGVPSFSYQLRHPAWFRDDVLYLAPQPDTSFRQLTQSVVSEWPAYPPYGGAHPEVVPHLTIGDGAPPEDLRRAEREVTAYLPLSYRAEAVTLMAGSNEPGSWSVLESFPLGGSPSGTDARDG